jgi:ribokinase
MSVVVFGSINMDLVVQTPRLPAPGETLAGRTFFTAPGGKGANQAVASARMGVPTHMVGRVGADMFADPLRASLAQHGVGTSFVHASPGPSGVAVIAVDDAAENTIVIVAGANGLIGGDDVARLEQALVGARVLLLQLEVPLPAVVSAAQVARRRGVTVVLDPAPACELPPELYQAVDIITPNESEAGILLGFQARTDEELARAGRDLIARGAGSAIVKLGARGAYYAGTGAGQLFAAFPVQAVDTVAAGDAFNGALAAGLCAGLDTAAAIRWGLAAGAISVTRRGAQQAMPSRDEVLQLAGGSPA